MAREETLWAYDILNKFLESNHHRKTPERYAVLEAIYGMDSHFTIEALNDALSKKSFRVSRATLYNCVNLFLKLGIVVRHYVQGVIVYEAVSSAPGHVRQICRICGKVAEQESKELSKTIEETKFGRFHKENFMLYLYGVCGKCQVKMMRKNTSKTRVKSKSNNL